MGRMRFGTVVECGDFPTEQVDKRHPQRPSRRVRHYRIGHRGIGRKRARSARREPHGHRTVPGRGIGIDIGEQPRRARRGPVLDIDDAGESEIIGRGSEQGARRLIEAAGRGAIHVLIRQRHHLLAKIHPEPAFGIAVRGARGPAHEIIVRLDPAGEARAREVDELLLPPGEERGGAGFRVVDEIAFAVVGRMQVERDVDRHAALHEHTEMPAQGDDLGLRHRRGPVAFEIHPVGILPRALQFHAVEIEHRQDMHVGVIEQEAAERRARKQFIDHGTRDGGRFRLDRMRARMDPHPFFRDPRVGIREHHVVEGTVHHRLSDHIDRAH